MCVNLEKLCGREKILIILDVKNLKLKLTCGCVSKGAVQELSHDGVRHHQVSFHSILPYLGLKWLQRAE